MADEKPQPKPENLRAPKGPSKLVPITNEAAAAYAATRRMMDGGIPEAGTDRWCWANGIITDGLKTNLALFAYMSHPQVPENGVDIVIPEEFDEGQDRYIAFKVALPRRALKRYVRYKRRLAKWSSSKWLPIRWLAVRLADRNQKIDLEQNLRRSVREYLGVKVTVLVEPILVEI